MSLFLMSDPIYHEDQKSVNLIANCFDDLQAMKTDEDSSRAVKGGRRYSVRFEGTRKVSEFSESEIIGPGFQNVSTSKLRPGQNVYITYCNREVQGSVVCHRPTVDQVIIRLLVSCCHSSGF